MASPIQQTGINRVTGVSRNVICLFLIASYLFIPITAEASDGWLESPACISAKEMGSENGVKLTPQDLVSTLVKGYREAGAQGVEPKIEEINIGDGKVAMLYGEIEGSQHGNMVITNNRSACHKFYSYCSKERIDSAKKCFNKILSESVKSNIYSHSGNQALSTTAGMNQEMGNNTAEVNKKLNEVYGKLLKEMPPEFKGKLIKSEQVWIKYRDSTVAITAWQEAGGTAQLLNQDGEYLKLEKDRLKFLESILNQE